MIGPMKFIKNIEPIILNNNFSMKRGLDDMNKEEYIENRNALLEKVQMFIDDCNADSANEVMTEIEELDTKWQETKNAMANYSILNNTATPIQDVTNPGVGIADMTTEIVKDAVVVETTKKSENEVKTMDNFEMNAENAWKSEDYVNAWAKTLMGKPLTEKENDVYRLVNETLTTENSGSVVPNTIANGIWSEVEDMYPYFADITKTSVPGTLTIIRANESSDAEWYDEDTETEVGSEEFDTIQLNGCELARAISVSWKLKEMAVSDFVPYITRRMADAMGAGLGYGVMQGQGANASKPEPTGIITALEEDGNQVVEGDLNYKTITGARALIKSGYANGIAVYANAETIWKGLANVVDDNGHPIFIHDAAAEGGVFRVLGMVVKEDASVPTGDVLMSNASRGYQGNVNQQVRVVTEDHARQRITDYVGYAIFDGAPVTYKAHSLIKANLGE